MVVLVRILLKIHVQIRIEIPSNMFVTMANPHRNYRTKENTYKQRSHLCKYGVIRHENTKMSRVRKTHEQEWNTET